MVRTRSAMHALSMMRARHTETPRHVRWRGVRKRALNRVALIIMGVAVLGLVATTAAALWTPGDLNITTARDGGGHERIAWVVPDSMAAGAGVARGETVVGQRPAEDGVTLLIARPHGAMITLGPDLTHPTVSDLLDAALGLWLLLLGALVRARARPSGARAAFWAMCLTAGLALGEEDTR